jgi:MFS transporter, SP family, general alpha glucoside:H+ symporter
MSISAARPIFVPGISILTGILLIIGILSAAVKTTACIWAQASLCLVWQLLYSLTIGPVAYAIISETSALRLRAQTVVLASNAYNVAAICSSCTS